MNNIAVSSPGKLMLFGEHAVIAGYPCIVTAVDQRIKAIVEITESSDLLINAPEVGVHNYRKKMNQLGKGDIPKAVKFVELAVKNTLDVREKGLKITTSSGFSSQFGFGSSSAVTVCIVKAISELLNLHVSENEIFNTAYKTVLDVQGKGSGFDIAAAVYGKTLYFVTGGKEIESLHVQSLHLVIGYSGIKADTVTLIDKVEEKFKNNTKQLDEIYQNIAEIVEKAKFALLKNDFTQVGKLMNSNQKLLSELGVSIPKLDAMIHAANDAGAYGAKLSGAGGGDCMIAVCSKERDHSVKQAITNAGGTIIDVKTNAKGVHRL